MKPTLALDDTPTWFRLAFPAALQQLGQSLHTRLSGETADVEKAIGTLADISSDADFHTPILPEVHGGELISLYLRSPDSLESESVTVRLGGFHAGLAPWRKALAVVNDWLTWLSLPTFDIPPEIPVESDPTWLDLDRWFEKQILPFRRALKSELNGRRKNGRRKN